MFFPFCVLARACACALASAGAEYAVESAQVGKCLAQAVGVGYLHGKRHVVGGFAWVGVQAGDGHFFAGKELGDVA